MVKSGYCKVEVQESACVCLGVQKKRTQGRPPLFCRLASGGGGGVVFLVRIPIGSQDCSRTIPTDMRSQASQ